MEENPLPDEYLSTLLGDAMEIKVKLREVKRQIGKVILFTFDNFGPIAK